MIVDKSFKYQLLKNLTLKEAETILIPEGFKMVKSDYSFKKKVKSSSIEIAFGFVDYYPDSYEYHFVIMIKIKELEDIVQKFFKNFNIPQSPKWNTVIWEGDFVNELKGKEMKFRSCFHNEIYSVNELKASMSKTLSILKNKALPLAYSICSLNGFQEYYLSNKEEVVKNFASNELFISSFLAAYLKSDLDFDMLRKYVNQKLDEHKKNGILWTQLYSYLDKLEKFVVQEKANMN